ncbi:hypothetical protein [Hymenobacter lapidiphilus]|uniref:hypothetical protein n=1 Tax=Hymenobacter lapidiphilus TaxID=2608003 RepID=UPI001FED1950|nr:hypothetical protein [Hymenobacter lapidiphilus]
MPKSAYQKQADKRTKDAIRLRARFDGRVRKYAAQLVAALTGALNAQARLDLVNQLYGVDISTETIFVHDLRVAGLGGQLSGLLGQSEPGEEIQLFNPTVDGNGGELLPLEALFGESANPTGPVGPGGPTTPPAGPVYNTPLNGPNSSGAGVTLAASPGDILRFDERATGGSAPATMTLAVGNQQVASVDYFDRYAGAAFSFEHQGVVRYGVFGPQVDF